MEGRTIAEIQERIAEAERHLAAYEATRDRLLALPVRDEDISMHLHFAEAGVARVKSRLEMLHAELAIARRIEDM